MKLGRILCFALASLMLGTTASAQDIHFSQFYASPLNLNPAMTGVMPCDARVSLIYRNQWASVLQSKAFNTFSAGGEMKFGVGQTGDYYGLGMVLWADRAGSSAMTTVQGQFSGSYLKRLGGKRSNESYLTAGGQIGFTQRSFQLLELMYGSQWTGNGFDGTLPSGENLGGQRVTFADVSAGLMYFMALDKKNQSNFYVGMAFHHLTRANLALLENGFDALFMKTTIHGGGEFRMARRLAIIPVVAVHFQGPSVQSNFGASVKFDLSKRAQSDQAFQVGTQMRLVSSPSGDIASDALIFMTRLRFGSSHIGLSYDVTISQARAATNMNGALELSYVYTLCGMRGRPMGCPTF